MSDGEIRKRIESIAQEEYQEIITFIRRFTISPDTAEDFLQDAFLEALQKADQIQQPERLVSWIKTVAKRKAIRHFYEYCRIVKSCVKIQMELSTTPDDQWLSQIILADLLCRVTNRCPPYYKEVVRLRYLYNLPYVEISRQLHISPSAARQANFRVIQAIRKEIRRNEE